ncbi:MAG: Gfo/Idh/MocA family oxidoreductase [Microbacterium arborescens]
MGQPHAVGIVGLGVISAQYLDTLVGDGALRIVAVADLDSDRSRAVAERLDGCRALGVADLMSDPAVETILNLTVPAAHADVAVAALAAGKNVYGEKPLAATVAEGEAVLAAAGQRWVGAAPDTVLGTGVQTARALVDAGEIGTPVAATATWVSAGHERWHPNPDFYYRAGGGPLLDMGPYYLTSLVHLLGPVVRVAGRSSRSRDERIIASGPRAGERIPVEVDTHVTGVLEHAGGALSTVTFSFDAAGSAASPIEVHGERGSLVVPDPNLFDGEVGVIRSASREVTPVPAAAGYRGAGRGIGLLDFVRGGAGAGRASGALALHVLEVMSALTDAARERTEIALTTAVERPPLVPLTAREAWRTL